MSRLTTNSGRWARGRQRLIAGFLVAAWSARAFAAGTEGASFLDIPVGARPAALGSAYTALAADAYAAVWNPAGLGFVKQTEVAGQHLDYLESIHDEYLGFAQPVGHDGAVGASIQYLGSGDIASTDNNGDPIGTFSSRFASYRVAYGRRFGDAFALGVTGQWVNARIGDFSANAYAGDVGALYRPSEAWRFGASIVNAGSRLTFINSGDALPLAGHLSAAFKPEARWLLTAEAVERAAGGTAARGGVEWTPVSMLSLRAGYRSDTIKALSAIAGMSAGMGLRVWGGEFSYAWLPLGDLGASHYFSVLVRFGPEAQRRNFVYMRPGVTVEAPADADLEEILRLIEAPVADRVVIR